jgi:hypothetical protein
VLTGSTGEPQKPFQPQGCGREQDQCGLATFSPVSFHSHIEACDFLRELLLNRFFLTEAESFFGTALFTKER